MTVSAVDCACFYSVPGIVDVLEVSDWMDAPACVQVALRAGYSTVVLRSIIECSSSACAVAWITVCAVGYCKDRFIQCAVMYPA